MTITTVPQIIPAQTGKPVLDNVPELQAFARAVAVDGVWTADIARATAAMFDNMAATLEFRTQHEPLRRRARRPPARPDTGRRTMP